MDLDKNYYNILGIKPEDDINKIKKSYYKLSFKHHPDKGGDPVKFATITEAYDVFCDDNLRSEWDRKSRWGKDYCLDNEFLESEYANVSNMWDNKKYQKFKDNELLNIVLYVDESFNGSIEYERWVICKDCKGTGKDMSSKLVIRDDEGNIIKIFESEDGCDYCEGTGKDWLGKDCTFCFGQGKSGSMSCGNCNGEKRIKGKQKIKKIKFPIKDTHIKIESMGHASKEHPGRSGYLTLVRK